MATIAKNQKKDMVCLALIKPNSLLAKEWKLEKPAYCIYEYCSSGTPQHQIRWGDGAWQNLEEKDFEDFVLLPDFDAKEIDQLFNF